MAFWPFKSGGGKPTGTKSYVSNSIGSGSSIADSDLFAAMRGVDKLALSDQVRVLEAQEHPIVMSCVRRIAWSTASVKLGVEAMNGDAIYTHPIAQMLAEPNSPGGRWTLMQLVASSLAVCGRAYVYAPPSEFGDRLPTTLAFLRTDKVQRIVDQPTGQISGYRYMSLNAGIGTTILPASDVIEIRHHWLTDHDDVFGYATTDAPAYSPMQASWRPMTLFAGLSDLVRKLLANNGGLPGFLVFEDPSGSGEMMSTEQKTAFADYLKRFRADGDKFGEIALLDSAGFKVNFVRITEDFKSLNIEAGKKAAVNEICAVYGVPPLILGMGEGATYANQKEARRYFWMDTIIPGYVEPICSALSQHFGIKIVPDLNDVPALKDYARDLAASLESISFLTINEKRRELGYEDIMGGDIVMVNPLMQPINRMLDANGNNLSDETDIWVANQEAIRNSMQTGEPLKLPSEQMKPAAPAAPAQGQLPPPTAAKLLPFPKLAMKAQPVPKDPKLSATEPRKVKKRKRIV